MKTKNFALLVVALAIVGLLIVACATPTPQVVEKIVEKPVEKVVKETVVVEKEVTKEVVKEVEKPRPEVRLSGWTASPEEERLLRSLLYECSVAVPEVLVKYEPIPADYWPKIKTMVASATEPDIYYMDIFQAPFFAQQGVMVPIDDYMTKYGVKREEFVASLIDAFTFEGKTYGIPKDFNTLALFYNKKLFDEAGLDHPTDDWTWDDLKAAAKALSKPDQGIYGFGVPPDAGRFPIFVFQNGGRIMSEDFSDTLLDSPEAIAAAEFYTGFRADGSGAIPADVGVGWQGEAFGKGQFAMVLEGGWLVPYLKANFPDLEFGAVKPPKGPKGYGNLIFTVAYVISKNSKNPEAAFQALNCLTSLESQTTVLRTGFALPSRVALKDDPFFEENPVSATIFAGAEGATPFMWGLRGDVVNEKMSQALERIYLEGVSAEVALKEAAEAIREALKE